jgi:hypothetical protein
MLLDTKYSVENVVKTLQFLQRHLPFFLKEIKKHNIKRESVQHGGSPLEQGQWMCE